MSATLRDEVSVTAADIGANFLLEEQDVGKNVRRLFERCSGGGSCCCLGSIDCFVGSFWKTAGGSPNILFRTSRRVLRLYPPLILILIYMYIFTKDAFTDRIVQIFIRLKNRKVRIVGVTHVTCVVFHARCGVENNGQNLATTVVVDAIEQRNT